ncbi:hypothetical protein COK37_30635 [Bacillus thuringiensis]|uniref:MoaD/ThiS family protein n=1 Tax=Bacillus thuringiensis TaxID=1428 RepID=UPI000BFA5082|nr:MoaD/ThiS family protein [Bacillus thuringiensis]PEV36750.1 hypothetical protein CN432_31095 [Bacillus thuringiensis]PFF71110.1 hypothetical protein CN339_26255 [Bacillus thuringiensis]PFR62606.1 hypothetical protein COK37_30635 [Bacillus thuringiensis]PFT74681.1 hypothetical protein COK70_27875 [Bacillus thuringiensis]PFV82209.1 hypothetical protein COL06_29370 [Bacillus thuringiensis]
MKLFLTDHLLVRLGNKVKLEDNGTFFVDVNTYKDLKNELKNYPLYTELYQEDGKLKNKYFLVLNNEVITEDQIEKKQFDRDMELTVLLQFAGG